MLLLLCPVWTMCPRLTDDADLCLAAIVGSRDVGWLELHVAQPGMHAKILDEDPVDRLLATNLLVDTSVRRCGIATHLLATAEQVAKHWGLADVLVSVIPEHAPSWNLFRKLGYRPVRAALSTRSKSRLLCKRVDTNEPLPFRIPEKKPL